MKRIKKFSQLLNESKESVNEGIVEDLVGKLGYKNMKEVKKQKDLLSKLESIAKEVNKREKILSEEGGEEGDLDLDLDLDLGGDDAAAEEPKKEEPKKEEEPKKSEEEIDKELKDVASDEKDSEEKVSKGDDKKSKRILSFDEFVSDKVEESIDSNDRFYNLSEIVEKYKDTNEGMLCEKCGKVHEGACEAYEKLEGHAKKMKEDGASDEEIKKMHPEVSDKDLNEAKINSDKEFEEYATTVLKKAFGSEFDEAKAKETIDGLKSKYKDDYGAMIGALTSGLGE